MWRNLGQVHVEQSAGAERSYRLRGQAGGQEHGLAAAETVDVVAEIELPLENAQNVKAAVPTDRLRTLKHSAVEDELVAGHEPVNRWVASRLPALGANRGCSKVDAFQRLGNVQLSRLAIGSIFCGSLAPVPITLWVWWLVRIRIDFTFERSPIFGPIRRARSISAWLWYSAEYSLV